MWKITKKTLLGTTLLTLFTISCQNQADTTEKNFVIHKLPYNQSWVHDTTETVHTIIAANDLIVGATTEQIFALSEEDGVTVWEVEFKTPNYYTANLSIANNILVASNNKELIALNVLTGKALWKKTIEVDSSNILDVSPNYIVIEVLPSWDIQVYDISTGDFLWETGGARGGARAFTSEVDENTVIIAGDELEKMRIDTGENIWSKNINSSTTSALKSNIFATTLRKTNSDNFLLAYNLDTEKVIWERELSASLYRIIFIEETMILGTSQGLLRINSVDGSILWEKQLDKGLDNIVAIGQNLFSRARYENTVYVFDTDSGEVQGYISFESRDVSFLANSEFAVTPNKAIAIPVNNQIYFFTIKP